MITFARTYHQGFSAGYTLAEAVKYADSKWTLDGYVDCDLNSCPKGFVPRRFMEPLESWEDQCSECSRASSSKTESDEEEEEVLCIEHDIVRKKRQKRQSANISKDIQKLATSSNKVKRKETSPIVQNPLNKRLKIHKASDVEEFKRKNVSPFFKELALIPKESQQPTAIYQIFSDRSQINDPTSIWLLTRLFFGIGSPTAFDQLRETCTLLRQSKDLPIPQLSNNLLQTLQALDRLDIHFSVASVLRRYHLVSLKAHRNELEKEHKKSMPVQSRRASKYPALDSGITATEVVVGFNRADSQALIKMMKEAYPHLKPTRKRHTAGHDGYHKELGVLKERLRSGRNWDLLQEKFLPPILALVPSGGEYKIHDSDIERLSVPLFTLFLEVLLEFRGDFLKCVCERISRVMPKILDRTDLNQRYVFKSMDGASLKQEPLDSARFVEFCEVEADLARSV